MAIEGITDLDPRVGGERFGLLPCETFGLNPRAGLKNNYSAGRR